MAGFLYFLPGAKQSDVPRELDQWGLGYLVDQEFQLYCRQALGPDNVHGIVVGSAANWTPEDVKIVDSIQWVNFPKPFAQRQAKLGYFPGDLPGPADLVRSETIAGKSVELADGHKWKVPKARLITAEGSLCNLPLSFDLDEESGEWISGDVLPRYRAIWQHANAYIDAQMAAIKSTAEGEQIRFVIPDGQRLVADSLQVNYRVSERELATLGVLTSGIAAVVAEILIDSDGFEQIKKKEADDIGDG